ncbi:hypothetical protein PoB_002842900 [Plakobranchus ocellatus]|uniref:Uncharacterized protein n=1 Tax=Plakobranchus ocellatus TaxID=259542 RepID=A0AAV4A2S1_9GAST|nr:hypothetical protein PoB_002842900 [Plakobranchus ocellatus]
MVIYAPGETRFPCGKFERYADLGVEREPLVPLERIKGDKPRDKFRFHNKVISGFQALRQAGRQWRDPNLRRNDPYRFQRGLASHCGTNKERKI